jgi:hypothetical protein
MADTEATADILPPHAPKPLTDAERARAYRARKRSKKKPRCVTPPITRKSGPSLSTSRGTLPAAAIVTRASCAVHHHWPGQVPLLKYKQESLRER